MGAIVAALIFGGGLPPTEKCATTCWPTEPLRCTYVVRTRCELTETPCWALPAGSICTPAVVDFGAWEPRPGPTEWPADALLIPPQPVPMPSSLP